MGLDNVLQSIRKRGQRRAEQIKEEAKANADELLAEASQEAEAKLEEAKEAARRDAEPLRRREVLSAEIEAKKQRLEAERSAMQSVRDRAKELLADLSADERTELLGVLVEQVESDLDDPRIYAATDDAEIVEDLAGDRFAGTEPIWGGIVAESADGEVRVDYSFETLLDETWQDAMDEVAETLREG